VNIQIFGTKKCKETGKAERFFKERGVKVQFINLKEKGLSRGELKSVSTSVPLDELIDKKGKEFEKQNLAYIWYNTEEKLLEFPLLFKTPVVRNGKKASVGYNPELWKEWLK